MMARLPSILKKAQHKITAREKLHLGREVLKMAAVVPDLSLLLPEILLNHIYLIFLLPSDGCLYICSSCHELAFRVYLSDMSL